MEGKLFSHNAIFEKKPNNVCLQIKYDKKIHFPKLKLLVVCWQFPIIKMAQEVRLFELAFGECIHLLHIYSKY